MCRGERKDENVNNIKEDYRLNNSIYYISSADIPFVVTVKQAECVNISALYTGQSYKYTITHSRYVKQIYFFFTRST